MFQFLLYSKVIQLYIYILFSIMVYHHKILIIVPYAM